MKNLYSFSRLFPVFFLFLFLFSCKKDDDTTLVPEVSTNDVLDISQSTASCGGIVLSDNGFSVIARGVCWSTNPNPTINDSRTSDGVGGGSYVSQLMNLSGGTLYYIRAYATNSKGTGYGITLAFQTLSTTIPQVESIEIIRVNESTVAYTGNVTQSGGSSLIQKGFCWSTFHSPTIDDNITLDGNELGEYSGTITGLSSSSVYYFRAYAKNNIGVAYGDEITYLSSLLPSINLVAGVGYVSDDITLKAGEPFKVKISASSNLLTQSKLVNLKVLRSMGGNSIVVANQTIDLSSFQADFNSYAAFISGTEQWTFSVTDANGEYAETSINIFTTAGNAIDSYSNKILGSYTNSSYGAFFSSSDGSVYKMIEAYNNQNKIDWCYFYGISLGATLAAPNDPTAMYDVFTNVTYGLLQWTVRNATTFCLVTESILWDNITDDAMILAYASNASNTNANQLTPGSIVAFKTAESKLGLIKIIDITSGSSGSITFDVKVQQ